MATWSVSLYHIRLGSQIYGTILEEFPKGHGDTVDNEHNIYPQTDDQSERTIQILEDMLCECVLDLKGSLEEHSPLVEFAYNNSY